MNDQAALFLYECVITLTQEVNVIWHRKWTATTWLYAFTRYVTVLDQTILLLPVRNFAVSRAYLILYLIN